MKKWKEPRRPRMMGPIGDEARERRSSISRRVRICQAMMEMAPAPMGFWTMRTQRRIFITRRRYREPWALAKPRIVTRAPELLVIWDPGVGAAVVLIEIQGGA